MTDTPFDRAYRLAGRSIIAGFDGTSLPDDIALALEQGALGGVILFRRNVESHTQAASLLNDAKRVCRSGYEPILSVDQEGGRVIRLGAPLTQLPAARALGKMDDPQLTYAAGQLVGLELNAVGFNLDFAPVLDVDTRPDSPVIGDRSFGSTADKVVRHGLSFGRGLRDSGVLPCAKHFPGHGDADLDSHLSLPKVRLDRTRLESVELEPFAAWARAGMGPMMTAHVIFSALDPLNPATTSLEIIGHELRNKLGFAGAVFTDDLEMGAIEEIGGIALTAVKAINAGVDGLCISKSEVKRQAVQHALAKKAMDDPVFEQRLHRAVARLSPLGGFPGPRVNLDWIGSRSHREKKSRFLSRLNRAEENA